MAGETNANQNWNQGIRYVAMIVIALVLAALLGSMDLFAKTTIAKKALSGTKLVHFIGYSAALAAFWMLGQHVSKVFRQLGGRWAFLQHLILPTVTLIVIAASYSAALPVLRPFMHSMFRDVYKWTFIAAIITCSIWLVAAVLGQSNSLTEALVKDHRNPQTDSE